MPEFQSSIIIPVFNQWELTRACLKAIAATTKDENVEVIVVDNTSTDPTPRGCPYLGTQLFGEAFRYVRNEQNRNFGPASNQGAMLARGEYLIFLNNDTVPLKGWYRPLLEDFRQFANLAATGPLLVFPKAEPFGYRVQHLGVYIDPFLRVGHLYKNIPAQSQLAQKRRFFQVITAACMMMPKKLFMEIGMFDEAYVNGFEDVDLCARLAQKGLRMTVNPAAVVEHHQGQSSGRHDKDLANATYLASKGIAMLTAEQNAHPQAGAPRLTPDMHIHLQNDDLLLQLNPWLHLRPMPQPGFCQRMDALAHGMTCAELNEHILKQPYWESGWRALMAKPEYAQFVKELRRQHYMMFMDPLFALEAGKASLSLGDIPEACLWINTAAILAKPIAEYKADADARLAMCRQNGLNEIAAQFEDWFANVGNFEIGLYAAFMKEFVDLAKRVGMPLDEQNFPLR